MNTYRLAKLGRDVLAAIEKINGSMRWPSVVLLITLAVVICQEVFRRYVLNSPTTFSSEFIQMLQVCLAVIGLGYVLSEEGHVYIEILLARLKPKWRGWANLVNSVIGAVYCGVLAWPVWSLFECSLIRGERTQNNGFLVYPVKLLFFVGLCFFGLQFIVRGYKYYRMAKTGAEGFGLNNG